MRTNIELDDGLVKQAFSLSPAKTKRELVDLALKEFVQNRRTRPNVLKLAGKIRFYEGYDHKKLREGRA